VSSASTSPRFHASRAYIDDRQLVEITALLPLANLERFNATFGIGLPGFCDLMVCVLRPEPAPSLARVTGPAAQQDGH
jgi:hypothetical protein